MEFNSDMEVLIYVIQDIFKGRIDELEKNNINQFNQLDLFKNQMKIIDNIINKVNIIINNDNNENCVNKLNEYQNDKNKEIKMKYKRANSEINIKNKENGIMKKK